MPGTSCAKVAEGDSLAGPLADAAGRPLVLVVRDAHRYPWVLDGVTAVLAQRPDAIVVEMGIPMARLGERHIATYGATTVAGRAAAELLSGVTAQVL
jgi:beta-N-acetylhexosaminidase